MYRVEVLIRQEPESRGLVWIQEAKKLHGDEVFAWRVVDVHGREVAIYDCEYSAHNFRNLMIPLVKEAAA